MKGPAHPETAALDSGSPAPIAELWGVGKRHGKQWALRNIGFRLFPGEIVGFIGPNGAGKTTLMRLLAGLSSVSEGQLTVLGQRLDGRPLRTPPGIGVMLEQMGFLPSASGLSNLEMLAGLRGVVEEAVLRETLARVGLDPSDRRPVRVYSLGMCQRLALAQALIDRPRLLLLDEPTNGLDPAGIVELRGLLVDLASSGTAIFLASHLLTEVERICHRVLLVRAGEMWKEVDLREQEPARVRLVVATKRDVEAVLAGGFSADIVSEERGSPVLSLAPVDSVPDLVDELVRRGVRVEAIGREHRSLEQEFLTLFGSSSRQ